MTGDQYIIRAIQELYRQIELKIGEADDRQKECLYARMEELTEIERKIQRCR